jgi:hypothetical protein
MYGIWHTYLEKLEVLVGTALELLVVDENNVPDKLISGIVILGRAMLGTDTGGKLRACNGLSSLSLSSPPPEPRRPPPLPLWTSPSAENLDSEQSNQSYRSPLATGCGTDSKLNMSLRCMIQGSCSYQCPGYEPVAGKRSDPRACCTAV